MSYALSIGYTPEGESLGHITLNGTSMHVVQVSMHHRGMGYWSVAPERPDPLQHGFKSIEEYCACAKHELGWMNPDDPRMNEYSKAMYDYLGWRAPGKKGIALHKFSSNDGWEVTGTECAEAIEIDISRPDYEAPNQGSLWSAWMRFLHQAAESGGFRVW